jgi:hypothetical protein
MVLAGHDGLETGTMTTYTLVMFIYAGILSKGDSVTLTQISGFSSEESCKSAGIAAAPLVKGTVKEVRFACLPIR